MSEKLRMRFNSGRRSVSWVIDQNNVFDRFGQQLKNRSARSNKIIIWKKVDNFEI